MVVPFREAIELLRGMGFFDVVLPFLLIFSIVYGALTRTKFFGEEATNVNAVVAFTIAMITVSTTHIVALIIGFSAWAGFLAVVVVCFAMLLAIFWGEISKLYESVPVRYGTFFALAAIFALILLNLLEIKLPPLAPEHYAAMFAFGVIIGIIALVVYKPKEK